MSADTTKDIVQNLVQVIISNFEDYSGFPCGVHMCLKLEKAQQFKKTGKLPKESEKSCVRS